MRGSITAAVAAVAALTGAFLAFASVAGTADLDRARYRLNQTPQLEVADADLNTDPTTKQTATVTLASDTDPAGISIILRESDVNTGVFNDEVTPVSFTNTGGSNDLTNTLRVDPGDALTMSYVDAAPAQTATATAAMFIDDATTALDAAAYTVGDTATLSVGDVDADLDPAVAETVSVGFASDSDPVGISVTLTETGPATGSFTGTATFSTTASNDPGDVLLVGPSDTVTLDYDEPNFAGLATIARTDTALIQTVGTVALNAERYRRTHTATLTVNDPDLNTSPLSAQSVDVTFRSVSDPTGISVTLDETGLDTGIFDGTATFSTTASNDPADVLLVAAGETVTLSYGDTAPVGARTTTALLFADGASATLNAERYRRNHTATLTVSDVDGNLDGDVVETVSAGLASSTDPTGITVTLTETGAATGVFQGTATFSALVSNDLLDQLLAASGATVTMTFAEPNFAGSGTIARTDTATMFLDSATASLDADRYALDDSATMTINDVDGNLDSAIVETVSFTMTSTSDATGIAVTATETGPGTGVFQGTATFTTGTSNDPGDILRIAAGDTITATYQEPNFLGTANTARTDTAAAHVDGTALLTAATYAVTDTATLRVTDADLNTAPGSAQAVAVTLSSTSDAAGISVTLTETGANTGVFEDTATFSATASDDPNDILHAASGDVLTLTYADATTFAGPPADRTDTARMLSDDAVATLNAQRYRLNHTATLTVSDTDRNLDAALAETLSVGLRSVTDPIGISVTLTETGAATGVFTGTATFSSVVSNDVNDVLQVSAGGTVTLTYTESVYGGGTASRTDTAKLYADTAVATLDLGVYDLDDGATLTVTDVDGDLDDASVESVNVTLTSTADPAGIAVTLTETGIATGTFTGSATFSASASDDPADVLRIAGADTLTLTYAEPNFAGNATIARTDTARVEIDGSVALDALRYTPADTATITVTDGDENTDAGTAQTVPITLSSDADAAGISVTLTETGANTGIFTGTATFSTVASNDAADVLKVAAGDALTAIYAEDTTFTGPDVDRVANATLRADTATAAFGLARYALDDTAGLTVADTDADTDAATPQTVTVDVTSSSDGTGIAVTLTETGPSTGVFSGSATFSPTASNDAGDVLLIGPGDLLTVSYDEPLFAGGTAARAGYAQAKLDATANLNATTYQLDDTATITVADGDENTSGSLVEVIQASLASDADPGAISVSLTETAANSGTFTGTATFSDVASDDAADVLLVTGGDVLRLTYTESSTFAGPPADRTDVASVTDDGSVALDAARYRLDDAATITVADADANGDGALAESVTIALRSDADATGIGVALSETGPDTGVFEGQATFSASASDDPADVLLVAAGDDVTAAYTDATPLSGPSVDRTARAAMFADTASAAFDAARYALDDAATVTVDDADANADPGTIDTVTGSLSSSADGAGISLELSETGADTGVFTGSASFSDVASDDAADVLLIAPGDTLTAGYDEPDFAGAGTIARSATARAMVDGGVAFDAGVYHLGSAPVITLTDADLDTGPAAQSVTVGLVSAADATGISVALTETGPSTGVFTGTATFSASASDDAADVLLVAPGDDVTALYGESSTFEGPAADRKALARLRENGSIALDARRYRLSDTATLTVTDADLDADPATAQTVAVTLTSTADPAGITVSLTETGPATGVFTGTATFSASASDDASDVLLAAAGDGLTATYHETTTFQGPDADRTASAAMFTDAATVTLADAVYPVSGSAIITVDDPDRDTDAATAQTVGVALGSTADAAGISVTLTETGPATGVFTGTATFSASASDDVADVLLIAPGDAITARYAEPGYAGTGSIERTDTARAASNGTAALDAARYAAGATVSLSVSDPDLDTDAATAQTVGVALGSETDTGGIGVTLTETGPATGVFAGSASLVTTASDDAADLLRVSPGDALTMTYAESTTFAGAPADRTDTAGVDPNATGVAPSTRARGLQGIDVTISGEGFRPGAAVTFASGGVTVHSTTVSPSSVIVNVDLASGATLGARDVTVTNTNGGVATCAGCFTISDGPGVASVVPPKLARGVRGVDVAINGVNFQDGATVSFAAAGVTVNSTTVVSSSKIVANVDVTDAATTGPNGVTVANPDGGQANGSSLLVQPVARPWDFDGDGTSDLAIGVPGDAVGGKAAAGAVNVVYGTFGGLRATGDQLWHQAKAGVESSPRARERFGAALAWGDFNGDGFADLVVGVPGETVSGKAGAGGINVLYGSAAGLTAARDQWFTQDSPGIWGVAGTGDAFGSALAAGDFDGDGFADLAVGAPGDVVAGKAGAGFVNTFHGSAIGLAGSTAWHQDVSGVPGASGAGHRFGGSLAAGDFDGDGDDDLAVGAPGHAVGAARGAGAVVVLPSDGSGIGAAGATLWHQDTPGIASRAAADERFAEALTAGDFDGDGDDDLVAGVPGERVAGITGAGGVHVLHGSGSGLGTAGNRLLSQASVGIASVPARGERFGAAVASGDVDGDGRADLAIGVPGEALAGRAGAGTAHLLFGSASGLWGSASQHWHQARAGVESAPGAGEGFGTTVRLADFDGDGFGDLAAGVPGERVSGKRNAGAVNVVHGRSHGLTAAGDQLWHQDVTDVEGVAALDDALGAAR